MPPMTRLFVKSALAYLVAALFVGVLVVLPGLRAAVPYVGGMAPAYFHLFMVGWVTQLIAGVAYWMFPKFSRTQPRGSARLAWATYLLLNAGLLLRVFAEPALGVSAWPLWGWLVGLAAVLQWAGGMAFVANTWPRVKEK
jgi:hypothetical protein